MPVNPLSITRAKLLLGEGNDEVRNEPLDTDSPLS